MTLQPGDLGWHLYPERHELKRPCRDCPFKREAEGTGYLRPERMEDIKFAVSAGHPFWCHETVYSAKTEWDGETLPPWQRHWRMCRGAADFVRRHAAQSEEVNEKDV